jgi:hypothetical protein
VRGRQGTSLLELLVVMCVWSFIMVAVLGFYIYGTRVNRRHGQMSEEIRAVQQVADKCNSYLRNARVLEVHRFPAKIYFDRVEEDAPTMPGVMLPNYKADTEWLRIGPDPARTGAGADPVSCVTNALFVGNAAGEDVVVQLPAGLVVTTRFVGGVLMLEFNEKEWMEKHVFPPEQQPSIRRWSQMNLYLQYRGMTQSTGFIGTVF